MRSLYLVSVYLHILAAILWLGGMLFLAAVALPALRRMDDPRQRARLLSEVGRRFRVVGWACIGVLVLTGVLNAAGRWGWANLANPSFWRSEAGTLLGMKLILVTLMLAMSAYHDFALGPRLATLGHSSPGDPSLPQLRRRTVALARVEAVLGLAVVGLALLLVRPG